MFNPFYLQRLDTSTTITSASSLPEHSTLFRSQSYCLSDIFLSLRQAAHAVSSCRDLANNELTTITNGVFNRLTVLRILFVIAIVDGNQCAEHSSAQELDRQQYCCCVLGRLLVSSWRVHQVRAKALIVSVSTTKENHSIILCFHSYRVRHY